MLAAPEAADWAAHPAARAGKLEKLNEAVDYRLAMLGLSDEALPENVRGVDRAALGDAYLVVYSSSTKMSRAHEADERRLAHVDLCV